MTVAMRVIDLSFTIRPHFRWQVSRQLRSSHDSGALFQSSVLTVSCHAYTHVDAPVHFLPGDRDITAMPIDQWMGPAAIVDLTHLGDNGEVTAEDLERRAGHVEAGDIVLLRTDWPERDRHDDRDRRGYLLDGGDQRVRSPAAAPRRPAAL